MNTSHNAGLLTDQKVRTRDRYYTVDKAIRHTMSTISSADGHCQKRKLREQWEKSPERAIFTMLLALAQTGSEKWEKSERAGKVEKTPCPFFDLPIAYKISAYCRLKVIESTPHVPAI